MINQNNIVTAALECPSAYDEMFGTTTNQRYLELVQLLYFGQNVMKNLLKGKRDFLRAYNLITAQGMKDGGTYELEGIKAWHDFEGYICWMKYNDLTVTMLFHNQYQFDYKHQDTVKNFIDTVDKLLMK